jgi:hypothetical protein
MKKQTKKTETDLIGKRYVVKDNNNNWFNLNEHVKIVRLIAADVYEVQSLERAIKHTIKLEQLTQYPA